MDGDEEDLLGSKDGTVGSWEDPKTCLVHLKALNKQKDVQTEQKKQMAFQKAQPDIGGRLEGDWDRL